MDRAWDLSLCRGKYEENDLLQHPGEHPNALLSYHMRLN